MLMKERGVWRLLRHFHAEKSLQGPDKCPSEYRPANWEAILRKSGERGIDEYLAQCDYTSEKLVVCKAFLNDELLREVSPDLSRVPIVLKTGFETPERNKSAFFFLCFSAEIAQGVLQGGE
jgi:hypothetical protein